MNVNTIETEEVPTAITCTDGDETREKLIREANEESRLEGEAMSDEIETEDLEAFESIPKPSKRKLLLAFAGFVLGFVFLVVILCWFFGIGAFARPPLKDS